MWWDDPLRHLQSSPRNSTNSINLMTRSRLTFGSCELWKWRHPMQFTTLECLGPTWSIDNGRLHKLPKAVFVLNGENIDCGMDFHKSIRCCCKCLTLKERPTDYWNYGANACRHKLRHPELEPARCHILHLSDNDACMIVGINNDFVLEVTTVFKTIYIPFISRF